MASLTRRPNSNPAIVSADDDQTRLAGETEGLLRNGDREHSHQRQRNGEYTIGFQWSSYARAALHFNKVYVLLVFVPLGIAASTFGKLISIQIFCCGSLELGSCLKSRHSHLSLCLPL